LRIRTYLDFVTGGRSALIADAEPGALRELRSAERRAAHALAALDDRTDRAASRRSPSTGSTSTAGPRTGVGAEHDDR
jgi:hypothetical protein